MVAALNYQTNHDKDILLKTPLWKEWLAFLIDFLIGFPGGEPFKDTTLEALAIPWICSYNQNMVEQE